MLTSVSVDECKAKCCQRRWCKSFDYDRDNSICELMSIRSTVDVPLEVDYENSYDHYELVIDRYDSNTI